MTAFSDFFELKIIDHMLRAQAYTPPATVYGALYTTATTDAGGGTEVTGGSYARQPVSLGAAVAGIATNSASVNFSNMPAVTVTHFGLRDALTAGNLLMHNALTAPVTLTAGQTFTFQVGELQVEVR